MTPRQKQSLIGVAMAVTVLLIALVVALIVGWEDRAAAPISAAGSTSTSGPTPATSPPATTTISSTTTSSTTSTSTTTTSPSTTTTTTLPPGACLTSGVGPIPAGSAIEAEAMGDFDGDGAEDRFVVYGPGDPTGRVGLAYGWAGETGVGRDTIETRVVNLGGPVDLVVVVDRGLGGTTPSSSSSRTANSATPSWTTAIGPTSGWRTPQTGRRGSPARPTAFW